jgi:hypothetical protein
VREKKKMKNKRKEVEERKNLFLFSSVAKSAIAH